MRESIGTCEGYAQGEGQGENHGPGGPRAAGWRGWRRGSRGGPVHTLCACEEVFEHNLYTNVHLLHIQGTPSSLHCTKNTRRLPSLMPDVQSSRETELQCYITVESGLSLEHLNHFKTGIRFGFNVHDSYGTSS